MVGLVVGLVVVEMMDGRGLAGWWNSEERKGLLLSGGWRRVGAQLGWLDSTPERN